MKQFTFILSFVFLLLSNILFSQGEVNENNWQNGDIVFIKYPKMNSIATTSDKEKFNCMGIIFIENGHPMVYFAANEPLKKISFHEFIELSVEKKYSVKWLNETGVMNDEAVKTMRSYSTAKLGTAYDTKESLNSEELYNAEFIWKIYKTCIGTYLCEAKEIGANANKKSSSKTLENKYVTEHDIYNSELLE